MNTPRWLSRSLDSVGLQPDGAVRGNVNRGVARLQSRRRRRELGFMSYSQFGEDAFLHSLVKGRIGEYVDVGAGQPIRGSNTYALYRQGWRGVLIDPISTNVAACAEERPEDRVLQACVGASSGSVDFYEYDTYEFSTSSLERVRELEAAGSPTPRRYSVPRVALRDLGLRARPEEPTVLSIDVEGGEEEVLAGVDWGSFTPAILMVEEWEGPLGRSTSMMLQLDKQGYDLVAVLGVSSIYKHRDFA